MTRVIWKASLLILLLDATSVAAQSEESCSVGVLKGSYIFAGRGFIEAIEPSIQRVHYGVFVFDGAGKLSGKQSSSRGGKIGREKLEGYCRRPDLCSSPFCASSEARMSNPRSYRATS
jgi:hypothetical protein